LIRPDPESTGVSPIAIESAFPYGSINERKLAFLKITNEPK
jgi:hypothetical protein